jgi:predicted DNA-binding transcriptional regulator AlpA
MRMKAGPTAKYLGISKATLRRRAREPGFPTPIRDGAALVLFDPIAIEQWLLARSKSNRPANRMAGVRKAHAERGKWIQEKRLTTLANKRGERDAANAKAAA